MAFQAKVVKVMIASPGDVTEERRIARDVLYRWNSIHAEEKNVVALPIGWETHAMPEMGDRPQAIINKQILAECDLLVAMFWTRLGSPTGKAASGTAEEIEEHLKAGKHAMLYFSSAPVALDSVDAQQYAALKEFKAACLERGLVETYNSVDDFREKLYRHFSQTINRVTFVRSADAEPDAELQAQPDVPALGEEARMLLLEATSHPDGMVLRMDDSEGLAIVANEKTFPEDQSARSRARWERVIRELEFAGLLADRGYSREVFDVTDEGFRVADLLRPGDSASAS